MSTQYDNIGIRYAGLEDLPYNEILRLSTERIIGRVDGLRCLDLACGLGKWTKHLIEKGASQAVGVDISSGMVEAADRDKSGLAEEHKSILQYHTADCSQPDFRAPGQPFDLALGIWLLNYAPSYVDLVNMFRAIAGNLKAGGRFVGVTTNTHCPMFEVYDQYGLHVEAVETTRDGWRCRLDAATYPEKVSFEYYYMLHDKYEAAAAEAGMGPIKWHGYILPDDERRDNGYWDAYQLRGHFTILSCYKPEDH